MTFLTNLLLLVCATIPICLANPVPNPITIPDPSPIGPIQPACTTSVHIDKQTPDVPGPVHGVGGTCTAGTAGQSNLGIPSLLPAPNKSIIRLFHLPKQTLLLRHNLGRWRNPRHNNRRSPRRRLNRRCLLHRNHLHNRNSHRGMS